jgi:hypothetical protein
MFDRSIIPAPSARYMPKAHAGFRYRLLSAAWDRYQQRQFPEAEQQRIGEIIAGELERLNPAADMDVLERYGLTDLAGAPGQYSTEPRPVTVSAYNPHSGHWEGVGLPIPRAVRIARSSGQLRANARAARKPEPYGVTPENMERHKREGTWAEVCANNERYFDELETNSLPPETDAFFQRVFDLRKAYRDEYQAFDSWLADRREADGKYPTWAEIEARFTFIGEFLAEARVALQVAA